MRHFNRTIFALILFVFVIFSCTQTTTSNDNEKDHKTDSQTIKQPINTNSDSLDFLKKFNGKYPNDVKLFDNLTLKLRLQKLLGNRYTFLKEHKDNLILLTNGFFYCLDFFNKKKY